MKLDDCLICGDCLEEMAKLEPSSVDAIVTDPPYGLRFMGKAWDHGLPGAPFWVEALRVAKPGAHLLAFGGTRTFHRLACAIEDAEWEIRDTLGWLYGSGFPKSHDVSKAIDKAAGIERPRVPGGVGTDTGYSGGFKPGEAISGEAIKWQGWGTALKPAWEPIILARKPLDGTVAENVQRYGTGAINVDGCRVIYETTTDDTRRKAVPSRGWCISSPTSGSMDDSALRGRWPANILHDGSEGVVGVFPMTTSGAINKSRERTSETGWGKGTIQLGHPCAGSTGSASRFFYCSKASKRDRDEGCDGLPLGEPPASARSKPAEGRQNALGNPRSNHHPTVKPTTLMRYLCRLITPPGGVILDPFMGSGSTGKAAVLEGFNFIGIEKESEYVEIARARIEHASKQLKLDLTDSKLLGTSPYAGGTE